MIQTNRTILFEMLNSRKENLISMVKNDDKRSSLTDEEIQEIRNTLEVGSFDELIRKFEPEVYIQIDTDRQQVSILRSLPEEASGYAALPIYREKTFFNALVRLMDDKKQKKYVLNSFQDFADKILPSSPPAPFLDMRDSLLQLVNKGCFHDAEMLLDSLIAQYDDGIFMVKTFLQQMSAYIDREGGQGDSSCFVLGRNKESQVQPLEISDRFLTWIKCTQNECDQYYDFLNTKMKEKSPKNQNLMFMLLSMACVPKPENLALLHEYYDSYLEFYIRMLRAFWREAKPLMEALLGIRSYFEQYTFAPDGEENAGMAAGMPLRLLVTNCYADFVNKDRYINALRLYLESVNEKNNLTDTIWYAILPGVEYAGRKQGNIRERFQSTGENREYRKNQSADMAVLMELLSTYKIQCFVSAYPVPESTFKGFAKSGMEPWHETFALISRLENKEYIIPCFPNFTVMPQEYAMLTVGYRTSCDLLEERIVTEGESELWLDALNVEAAYVAAGLVASCQCPEYLKSYYPEKVMDNMPGIAYQLCDSGHNSITLTQMFHEIIDYPLDLYRQIAHESQGMVFAPHGGRVMALTDRAYSFRASAPSHIADIQTAAYIERVIRYDTQDFQEKLIRDFFQERPGSILSRWKLAPDCVNGILKTGEGIRYEINESSHTCKLEIAFRRGTRKETVRTIY